MSAGREMDLDVSSGVGGRLADHWNAGAARRSHKAAVLM